MIDLEIVGTQERLRATDDELSSSERRLGTDLPASLKAFLREYGYGRFGGLILFYGPHPVHCDGLECRSETMRAELELALAESIVEFEPDGSAKLYRRAVPFARSENGGFFVFDPTAGDGNEREIYFVAPRLMGCVRAASSVDELVQKLTSLDARAILGPGYRPLSPTFEPLQRGLTV